MNPFAQQVQQYRRMGLLIDANLLLLYVVGLLDPNQIGSKRTEKYLPEDFDTLAAIIGRFERVITTPHILAEVSNLGGQFGGQLHERFFEALTKAISALDEQYVVTNDAMQGYRRLGVTDAGIIHIAQKYLILTDDFPLSQYLQTRGVNVLNFNHIRLYNWL